LIEHVDVLGAIHLWDHDRVDLQPLEGEQIVEAPGRVETIDANANLLADGDNACKRRANNLARLDFLAGRNSVFEIDDHGICFSGGERLDDYFVAGGRRHELATAYELSLAHDAGFRLSRRMSAAESGSDSSISTRRAISSARSAPNTGVARSLYFLRSRFPVRGRASSPSGSSIRTVPHLIDGRRVTSYVAKGGLRVDFLTPNEGSETGEPQSLPALQTHAQPLRFLDFLIHDPDPAVVLHGPGIYVQVPAPARYAVHKLIVSRRRAAGLAKSDKDLQQADALLVVLGQKRPDELRTAWAEAYGRGPTWRQLLNQGLAVVSGSGRDWLLKVTDGRRSAVPNLALTFDNPPIQYDFSRDVATFVGQALGSAVKCEISREVLDDHFGTDGTDQARRVEAVRKSRSKIEQIVRTKYLSWPVEEPGTVLIRTMEVPKLLREAGGSG